MNAHGVNTEKASIDAVIGGKDNFEVDREVAEQTREIHPAMPELTVSGRRWLIRAVGYLADRYGMDQYLELTLQRTNHHDVLATARRSRSAPSADSPDSSMTSRFRS